MIRTEFLRNATVTGANKCRREPLPRLSVADEACSLTERKALGLKLVFDNMPVYIGEKELIAGTRTWFTPNEGNEDGKNIFEYQIFSHVPYINEEDKTRFGCDKSYMNKTHFTPDFGIILDKGIDGIIKDAQERMRDASLHRGNVEFLSAVIIAYNGLKNLILRYEREALLLAESAMGEDRDEFLEIARICHKVSANPPESFREAVQLLWFAHLGTIIENFEFVNYGRLDVILGKFLNGTPMEEAQQIVECLLLKMYDQADVETSYLGTYSAQLNITLGGVLADGTDAVNDVTMMFLEAVDKIRLPEPEFSLRINSKNPSKFLDKAAELTVSGCNNIAYYNDDLFVESLVGAGIPLEYARCYGFDLCQDINIPGIGDFWVAGSDMLIWNLMEMLDKRRDYATFDELMGDFKNTISESVKNFVDSYNIAEKHLDLYAKGRFEEFYDGIRNQGKPVNRGGCCPMAPLPLLSALYHGSLEKAEDVIFEPYPVKAKGFYFGTAVETVNSLAAIKKVVYDDRMFTLEDIYSACVSDFEGEQGGILQKILWECPKWGNDDSYVDDIATELLEFCLGECRQYKTYHGGQILGGIHQPHPVIAGKHVKASPEGRKAYSPVAVTMTPESGTMKNGPTAVLNSASKIDHRLIQWNYCVMVNYYSSVFRGNEGSEIFKSLLNGYFRKGGMQHQPNVADAEVLKKAQQNPDEYKDLIVRLWGVSARFTELSKEVQDELIARF